MIPCTWRSPTNPGREVRPCPEPGTAGVADTGAVCRIHLIAARAHGRLKLWYGNETTWLMPGRISAEQLRAWTEKYGRDNQWVKTHIYGEYPKTEETKK